MSRKFAALMRLNRVSWATFTNSCKAQWIVRSLECQQSSSQPTNVRRSTILEQLDIEQSVERTRSNGSWAMSSILSEGIGRSISAMGLLWWCFINLMTLASTSSSTTRTGTSMFFDVPSEADAEFEAPSDPSLSGVVMILRINFDWWAISFGISKEFPSLDTRVTFSPESSVAVDVSDCKYNHNKHNRITM